MPDNFNNRFANRPLPWTETEVVDTIDEQDVNDCPSGYRWDSVSKSCVPITVKKNKEEINKTAPKDSKSLGRRNTILKKIENGFKVTIEEAQYLTKYGYSFTDGFYDRNTLKSGSNINEQEKPKDVLVEVDRASITPANMSSIQYKDGKAFVKKPQSQEQVKLLESERLLELDNVNKNKFREDFYNEYGRTPDGSEERKLRRIDIYDLDGKKISSNDQQDFQMLSEAISMNNPAKEARAFEDKWGVSLAEVLEIPEEEFDVEGSFDEYGRWIEKPGGKRNLIPGTNRQDLSVGYTPQQEQIANNFYRQYQNDQKFDNIRSFQGAETGSNLRNLDLAVRGGEIKDEGSIRNKYLEMSKQYGAEEGVIAPQLYNQYLQELSQTRDDEGNVAAYNKAVSDQTKDILNVVKGYLPRKNDASGRLTVEFDVDYAMEMRQKISQATTDQEANELSKEWLNYVKDFKPSAVDEETELLIDYKTGNFYTRKEINEKGGNLSDPDLMSVDEWIRTQYEQDDIGRLEQDIVNSAFEVLGNAKNISDSKTSELISKVGGTGGFALFDVIRNATTGVWNYDEIQKMAESGSLQEIAKELPSKYENIPGVSAYNQSVRKLKAYSEAYYMNLNPLTFEQDGFVDGFGDAATEWISGMDKGSPDEQKQLFANYMSQDFPEVWNQFSEADKAEFFETSAWRKAGTSTFDFGLIALDFAITKGLLGGATKTLIWGSKLGKAPGASGGLYNWTLRGLGPGTGKAGKGFATFSALTAEEAIYIEGVNKGISEFTRPGQEDMSLLFAPGMAVMKMLMNPKLLSSPQNEALSNNVSKMDIKADKLINSDKVYSGLATEVGQGVLNYVKGTFGGVASLKFATFADHGVLSPIYDYVRGEIDLSEAEDQFHHALHSLADAEDWAITTGSMIAAGGIPFKSTYVKGREIVEKYTNIITNESNKKYIDKFAGNIDTDYKTIFEDGQNTSEGTNYAVQRNRIQKAKEKALKKKGVVDENGNVDQIKYESNGASILNLAKAALKASGEKIPENLTHEQAFELLANKGIFENGENFQEFIDATGVEVLSSFNTNEFAANKRSVENVKEMIESGEIEKHKDHVVINQSAKNLENYVDATQTKNLLKSTEQQYKNILGFEKIAKLPNKNPSNFLSMQQW
jgi:ribosomal protein S17E